MSSRPLRIVLPIALALGAASCGESGGGASSSPSACEQYGTNEVILDNHPRGSHELELAVDDVAAGLEMTYDIQGDNTGHGHTVAVEDQGFAALAAGEVVTLTSSDTGAVGMDHTHGIILDCTPR